MKQFLLLTYCLLVGLSYSIFAQSNETNLRSINTGGKVIQDLAKNDWQYSIGEVFVAPIGNDNYVTQGFNQLSNQPDLLSLNVYSDSLHPISLIESSQTTGPVIGVDTSNASITRDFVLKNTALYGDLSIDSIAFVNGYFSVNKDTFTVLRNDTTLLSISLTEDTVSTYIDTIYIYHNGYIDSPFAFPVYAEITKEPTPELIVRLGSEIGPILDANTLISFGAIDKNDNTSQTIVIKNTGKGDLIIDDIIDSGSPFSIADFVPTTLAQGESITITTLFTGAVPGDYIGRMQIISNNPIFDSLIINLEGQLLNATTWTGTQWDNGLPNDSSIVTLTEDYSIVDDGEFIARKVIIQPGIKLNTGTSPLLSNVDSVINYGTINQPCINFFDISNKLDGNGVIDTIQPQITPDNSLTASFEEQFDVSFSVTQLNPDSTVWNIQGLPNLLTESNNSITGIPIEIDDFTIYVTAVAGICSALDSFELEVSGLRDPEIDPPTELDFTCSMESITIPKTLSYNRNTPFTYEIISDNQCVFLDNDIVNFSCDSFNSNIVVEISQEANNKYRSTSTTVTLTIEKTSPSIEIDQTIFNLNQGDTYIPYTTNPETAVEFSLIGDSSGTIDLSLDGSIKLLSTGLVPISLEIPSSKCYSRTRLDTVITVGKTIIPPTAINDTIRISIFSAGDTINLLRNDIPGTSLIDPYLIEFVLDGNIYSNNDDYYMPKLGDLSLNTDNEFGLLSITTNDISIGEIGIKYVITDYDGQSDTGTVVVDIYIPDEKKIPELEYRELYTPNGDSKNDIFIIKYLNENNPGDLTILDRLGNEVFFRASYVNDWDFTDDSGNMVDDGAYFFVYIEEGRNKLQGTFEIKRR